MALVAVVALTGSVMAADVNNGSFEGTLTPSWPELNLQIQRLDSSAVAEAGAIPSWTVSAGNVDWVGNSYWQASQGTKSVDLDGVENVNGAIQQRITTVVGHTYAVAFDLSGNPDNGPALKTGTVGFGASSASFRYDTAANDTTRSNMHYVPKVFSFTATSTLTPVTFTSTTSPGGFGPVIDNVVVTDISPTAANCKNGGWRTMFDSAERPFRNQGDCVSFFATDGRNLAAG